jgi:hypothetical protein
MQALRYIDQRNAGLLTDKEATLLLDRIGVRGSFEGTRYIGYDYTNQVWVEVPALG